MASSGQYGLCVWRSAPSPTGDDFGMVDHFVFSRGYFALLELTIISCSCFVYHVLYLFYIYYRVHRHHIRQPKRR